MSSRRRTMAVVALLAAVAGGSCGGDEERLTEKEFVARGNAVCADSEEKLRAAFEEELGGVEQPSGKQMQAVLKRVVPIAEGTVRRLKDLTPPEKLEPQFDDALVDAEGGLATLRKGASTPANAERVFSAEEDPFEKANQGFEAVGITRCAQGAAEEPEADHEHGSGLGAGGSAGAGAAVAAGTTMFVATEYRFAGPATLPPGRTTITLSNRGSEGHEIDIARLKDGVTPQQVVEAEAAGRDTMELVADDDVGHVGPVAPRTTANVDVDLVPGTYAYACFVEPADGDPHVAKGMFAQFTVA